MANYVEISISYTNIIRILGRRTKNLLESLNKCFGESDICYILVYLEGFLLENQRKYLLLFIEMNVMHQRGNDYDGQ